MSYGDGTSPVVKRGMFRSPAYGVSDADSLWWMTGGTRYSMDSSGAITVLDASGNDTGKKYTPMSGSAYNEIVDRAVAGRSDSLSSQILERANQARASYRNVLIVGGVAGAAVIGTIIYFATRPAVGAA